MAEMRLIAKATFQADLREAQVCLLNQQLGPGNALLADPVLGRKASAAFEGAGKMTARERTGEGQFADFEGFTEAFEDQLFNQSLTLWAKAPGVFPGCLYDCRADGVLL